LGQAPLIASTDTLNLSFNPALSFLFFSNGDDINRTELFWGPGKSQYSLYSNGTHLFQSQSFSPSNNDGWTIGTVSPSGVPEIDPATGGSAISLVAGLLAMIEQRRRRATLVA
jgi:hypothetical protein